MVAEGGGAAGAVIRAYPRVMAGVVFIARRPNLWLYTFIKRKVALHGGYSGVKLTLYLLLVGGREHAGVVARARDRVPATEADRRTEKVPAAGVAGGYAGHGAVRRGRGQCAAVGVGRSVLGHTLY